MKQNYARHTQGHNWVMPKFIRINDNGKYTRNEAMEENLGGPQLKIIVYYKFAWCIGKMIKKGKMKK